MFRKNKISNMSLRQKAENKNKQKRQTNQPTNKKTPTNNDIKQEDKWPEDKNKTKQKQQNYKWSCEGVLREEVLIQQQCVLILVRIGIYPF